jgi:hypothetical protein
MPTLPAHHPVSPVTESDLLDFVHLVPHSGIHLLVLLGKPAGLKLINGLAGVQVLVPKGPCNNPGGARVWAYLAGVIGLDAMHKLADEMGGECLEVPTLDTLRKARRNRAIRAEFDRLTARAPAGEGLSKARAVQELGLMHAPITWRQLENILDRPSLAPVCQDSLFE